MGSTEAAAILSIGRQSASNQRAGATTNVATARANAAHVAGVYFRRPNLDKGLALAPLRFLLVPEHLLACQVASSGGLDSGGGETLGGGFRCRLGLFCSPGRGFRDRFVLVC